MRRHERLYRRLLLILPRALRHEAEEELVEVFNEEHARVEGLGWQARVRFWVRMTADLVATSTAERAGKASLSPVVVPPATTSPMARMVHFVSRLGFDTRLSARRLAKTPGWTVLSAGTLALGLASSIVATVLVRDVLWRPLALAEPDRLVRLDEISQNGRRWWPSYPNAADWRDQARMFEGVGIADVPVVRPVLLDGGALRVSVARAGRGLFETLGIRPAAGRFFTTDEMRPGGEAVAMVSEPFWRSALDSRPPGAARITVGLEQFTVIGVLPRGFRYLGDGMVWTDPADIWTPLERDANLGSRTTHGYHVVARLRGDVSIGQAQREMNELAQHLKTQHRQPTQADSVLLRPLQDVVVTRARDPLRLLLYAAIAVLTVACLNLAAAILAQGLNRLRELSVRVALGASRTTLARHLLVEATVLAVPAAIGGLMLAALGLEVLRSSGRGSLPRLNEATLDPQAVAFGFLIAVGAACLAGSIPAIVLSRTQLMDRLRTHGAGAQPRDQRRLWAGFVTAQVMLTVVLLSGTGLLLRSFMAALAVDVGYNASRVLAVDVALPDSTYASPDRRIAFYDAALDRLRHTPGLLAAGLTNALPHVTSIYTSGTNRDVSDPKWVLAGYRLVDSGYFEAIGIKLLAGSDRAGPEGALIDRRLHDQLWPGENALGDRVINGFSDVPLTVTGMVGTVREWDQGDETTGAVYVDFHRRPDRIQSMHFVVRHGSDAGAAERAVRVAFAAVDPLVPVTIEPLETRTAESLAGRRLMLLLSGGFAIVAVMLAAAGVYAMVAFAVARQFREAAIRLALGAHPSSLRLRVIAQGFVPAFAGILLGAILAVPTGHALRTQLFRVDPIDPLVLACAAFVVSISAALASLAPARRASRVDPASALRCD